MPDPQVPADAVQEAQDILQNPAPGEAQVPAVQVQAPAQGNEVSLEVCETLFSLSFVSCSVLVLEYFVLFCFGSTLLFCFVRPVFTFTTFHVGFAGHSFCNLIICGFPCYERFAGYFVLNSYVVCPAVNVFAPLWALRVIFGLVYYSPCFLTFALFSFGLCGQL